MAPKEIKIIRAKKFRFEDDSAPGAGDGTPLTADHFNKMLERIERLEWSNRILWIALVAWSLTEIFVR